MRQLNPHALVIRQAGVLIGAGGGSSPPRQPVEGANTLQTNATIRVVDLIGEGEMRGLANGLQSVFIDGVPAANADGNLNIQGVDFEWRAGLPDQPPLDGIPEIESETIVNREIKYGSPLVRRITNAQADSARITLRFPRLVSVQDNGDTTTASVKFTLAVQAGTSVYQSVLTQTINDKNTSPAELSWRVPLTGTGPWNIRVTRVTKNSNSDKLHNTLWWARYTEITELKQSYPYSALMGITAEADKFTGQINKREYEVYGLIVNVPTNYNPDTRIYSGIWNGTFKRAWTDNPAWCLYHILTNRRFGLGGEIADEYLTATKWELYEISRFCDERVSDGQGGQEPRFRFSGVINKATDARKLLDHILSNFRGGMYYGGGAVVPVQDAPSDAVALLGNANVIDGEFEYADLPHSDRVSAVAMSFNDPEDGYKLGIELVVDDKLVAKYGYRQDDRVAMFCTSRSQAQRLARHILFEQEHESDQLNYSTGIEQASVRPGNVIKQSDVTVAGARVAFRVMGSADISVFDSATLTRDEVVYQGSGRLGLTAGGDMGISARAGLAPEPVLGNRFHRLKVFSGARQDRAVNINLAGPSQVSLPDEDNRAFALQFKQAGLVVATAWLPLSGEDDPYIWSPAEYTAIVPKQTFQADLFALGLVAGDFLDFDIALVRTDLATVNPMTLTITDLTLTADNLDGVDPTLSWTANLMLPDGTIEQHAVTAIDNNTLTLVNAPSTAPRPNAMVVLESQALSPRLWRVLSVAERDELKFKFTAHAYHPDKYAAVERDVEVNTYHFALTQAETMAAPVEISIEAFLYRDGSAIKSALSVSITPPESPDTRVLYIEFQLLAPGENRYQPLDLTRQHTTELRNVRIGVYTARARFVGEPLQITSDWVYSAAFNALGKTAPPSTPTNLLITILPNTGLSITIDPIPDLDRDEYSYWIGYDADVFTAARRLARVKSTELVISTVPAGTVRIWVQAHDTSDAINHGSLPATTTQVIRPPDQPRITLDYEGTDIVLTWDETQTDFRVAGYVIHHHRAPDDAILLANVTATTWRTRVTWQGSRRFKVSATDIAGNTSAAAEATISPEFPGTPVVRARTIDNTVLFNYSAAPGSLPVDRFEVRRGDDFNTSKEVAAKAGSSTFSVFEELTGGTYTYWWTAIDSAGNQSLAQAVIAVVAQPPDYKLFASYSAQETGWNGLLTNARVSPRGGLVMLVNTRETWRQHFVQNRYQTPRDQINASKEFYAQPSTNHSRYRQIIDYGTVIDQAQITVTGAPATIDGSGNVLIETAYRKFDTDPWIAGPAGNSFFATGFRYVRARVTITASDGDDLFYLEDMVITLDKKIHRDSGTATANALDRNGTQVMFNLKFIDAEQPVITPAGTTARIGVADFTDTPNPTGFSVYLFNTAGNRVSGVFGWQTSGYINSSTET